MNNGNWFKAKIGEIADIVGGGTPSTKDPTNFGGNIPWITPKDLANYPYRYISHGERFLSEKGLKNSAARLLPPGTVLLTSRAPVGYVAIAKCGLATNQGFRSLVLKDGFDPEFVYYLLKNNKELLESHASGSTFKELSGSVLKNIEFLFPPLPEQKAIAHILGTLDDKIELNRRMNETLEAIGRALFKSWFVDFDPVIDNALEAGNPIPDALAEKAKRRLALGDKRKPLPEHIRRLFPDRFVDSELGPIPEGWEVRRIGEVVRCVGGSTPSTKEPRYWKGGANPFVTPKDMSSLTSPVILDSERHITDAGVEQISSGLLPVGTVLLSSRAPIGYLAITEVPVSINQGIIAMICDGPLPNHYVLRWVETNMEVIKNNAGGTTFAEISKRNFRPISVIVPPKETLVVFVQQVAPLHQRVVANLHESRTLAALRDALLPKLISGEIRVKDTQQFLERAKL